jgi:hypothetical protein
LLLLKKLIILFLWKTNEWPYDLKTANHIIEVFTKRGTYEMERSEKAEPI